MTWVWGGIIVPEYLNEVKNILNHLQAIQVKYDDGIHAIASLLDNLKILTLS